jgi:hypothetical protein
MESWLGISLLEEVLFPLRYGISFIALFGSQGEV